MANENQINRTNTVTGEDISVYYQELKRYKPLQKEEEKALLKEYKENNDLVARQKLITANLRYAFSLVNKYKNRGVPLADLLEEANLALIDTIDKFDIEKDVKVITYAKWNILDSIQQTLKKNDRIPTDDLPEDYEEQLDFTATSSDEYSDDMYINSAFIDEDETVARKNSIESVELITSVLNEKETDFIKMYYGISPYNNDFTYEDIGKKYDITKERVRQIIDKIMRKLRVQALTILNK